MSEIDIINIKNGKQILKSIFKLNSSSNFEFSPIFENSTKIPKLISFLKNKENDIKEKLDILQILYNLFRANSSLILLFMKKNLLNTDNLYEPLIDLYLCKDISDDYKEIIEKILKLINSNITLPKSPFHYIYQKLSIYFNNIDKNKNLELLDEKKMMNYLNLLKIFYLEENKEKNEITQNGIINKEIKKYIYLNGKGSGINLILNENSINPNTNYPTLQYGISFIMWVYIDINLIEKLKELNKNIEIILVKLEFNGNEIKLILKDTFSFQICLNNSKPKLIQNNLIKVNDWNNIIFSIYELNKSILPIKLFINSVGLNSSLEIKNKFDASSKINLIRLLDNFIGKVSSVMIITKGIENIEANYFSNKIKYGFYKNKILFNFILENEVNYFVNCKNYEYYKKYKSNNISKLYDLHLCNQNIKNLCAVFCPFAYDLNNNQLDDIFGNFIGFLGHNDCAINYKNNMKNIGKIGGIKSLLPIMELMFSPISSCKTINHKYIDNTILTSNTFYEYLNLLQNIIKRHNRNLIDAINSNFFSSLSIFLQQLPSEFIDDKILVILIEIGKETIKIGDNINSRKENFTDMILLNEKILINYGLKKRMILWKILHCFFTSDDTYIKDFFNLKRICLLIRFFDSERYSKYCCKKHFEIIDDEISDDKILEPDMKERTKELFLIIQLYINKYCDTEDSVFLIKLLSFDISPCLQEKIIDIYIRYFSEEKIDSETKIKSFQFLLKNNFIELIEYVFSISLFDIKLKILSLFKILFDNDAYMQDLKKYLNDDEKLINNFYTFLSDNLLPEQIYIKAEKSNIISEDIPDNDEGLIPISYFFNKTIYKKEASYILTFLFEWALYKVPPTNNSENKKNISYFKIHIFIIDFLISFASKCPFNYIDLLLITLSSYFNDQTILNREILYTSKNLYFWLIETIFYFHNSEIKYHEYKKEDIISIQKNSIILFKDFFAHRRPHEEFNKQIYYIIRYSIHLKRIFGGNESKKIQEVTRIARLLLETLLGISSIHMNYKTKYFFDFMIFHKNFHSLTGIKRNVSNNHIRFNEFDIRRKITANNLITNINKLGLNTTLNLEENGKYIINKNIDDFNKININSNDNSFSLKEYDSEKNSNEDNDSISLSNISNIIPEYIFEGLYLNELKIDINKKDKNENTLNIYWQDFSLYDGIIDYYSSNIWGTENLRKKVGIELDDDQSKDIENLLKEYGENKQYRNILLKDILKCLTIKDSKKEKYKNKNSINILHINAILLSIALVLTKGFEENEFWEGKFTQFFLFCVLASININSNEIYYNLIQDNIYNTIGYACLFLRKWNKAKYKQLTQKLIIPILKKETTKKSKIFNIKNDSSNAIFRLFELRQKINNYSSDEISDSSDNNNKIFNIKTSININSIKNLNEFEISAESLSKDDSNIHNKQHGNYKVVFKGESSEILKKIFSEKLENIKEEKKMHITFKSNYKTDYSKQLFPGNIFNDEKSAIDQVIKNILILYEKDINNYGNEKYVEEKERRIKYKKIKANLFSWNGFWSNKYLFLEHPELLKLKIKNHYTKEMIKPLLASILDFEYYTPPFKSFDKNNLFNKNNYDYKINLDIDSILSVEEKEEYLENPNIKINTKEDVLEPIISKNKYGFNYQECSLKYSYNNLWDIYLNYSKKKDIYLKLIISGKQLNSEIINDKKTKEISFKCCRVKLTHHITGYICNKNEYILFEHLPFSIQDFENDIAYDNEMGCCFGSIFNHKKDDKDKLYTKILYNDIKYIFIRRYFYMETSIEFYTKNNKAYLFNFKSNKDLIQFRNILFEHWNHIEIKSESKQIIGYKKANPNFKKKYIMVSKKMEEWMNNNISTVEYLMWLNIYSGRSFNDLTQYPVFPWILMNYSEEENEEIKYRDLRLPMGMIRFGEKSLKRIENFMEIYESIKNDLKDMFPDFNYQDYLKKGNEYYESYKLKIIKKEKENEGEINIVELNQIPYIYGSHYSNPTYVSHFLVRIFPFSFTGIEIQGQKFDDPNRIFTSIYKTFECSTSLKTDVRELIPEFFYLPEFLLNDNNLDLAQKKVNDNNKLFLINDVRLPFWAKKSSTNFIIQLRQNLETYNITNNLNKWIDLIFGINQKGEKAEENNNIFLAHTYEKMVDIKKITDIDTRNSLMRLYEMGVTPIQIFEHETKSKNKNNNNFITLDEAKNLVVKFVYSNKFNVLKTKYYENNKYSKDPQYKEENIFSSYLKISKIMPIDNATIKIFTNVGHCYEIKIEVDESNKSDNLKIVESTYYKYKNNSTKYACSYNITNMETPIIVYNNNQSIIKGGFWDGRLEINNLNLEKTHDINVRVQTVFNPDFSPITTIEYSKKEKLFYCGSINGILYIYKLNDYIVEFQKKLYLFDDEITSISVNDTLNMFCASSKDGFINLHLLPSCELVRTIYLNKNNDNENDKNIAYANKIFLSNFPIPCIVAYINSKSSFRSYTINGKFINELKETNNSHKLKSPIIYKNNNFQDILIYGTNDGFIKIRKFPEMLLINCIEVFPNKEINEICISHDKKYCYVWNSGNVIALVKAIVLKKN